MNSSKYKVLTEKYDDIMKRAAVHTENEAPKQLILQKKQVQDEDTGEISSMGSDYESSDTPEITTALNFDLLGLLEPQDEESQKKMEKALQELQGIFSDFQSKLKKWESSHKELGAEDTISKNAVGRHVATAIFGLGSLE